MLLSNIVNVRLQLGLTQSTDGAYKDANLLAGDAILNYRTVAALGHEGQIIKDYEILITAPFNNIINKTHLMGLIFGFSQFLQYGVFALLFYVGAEVIQKNPGVYIEGTTTLTYKMGASPTDIFCAIFAIMFGAMAAGDAQQFGPDMGKANAAADKIFKIVDAKSEIDPLGSDEVAKKGITLDESFNGEIEFQNVWFRYPARKSDWILKGLNLKIRRNETVALVGESGCGKSTIVSLILRFYDVNKGLILLDGVDIREYKVADLRRALGFVM